MTAVAGHASGRAYIGPDGALHLNGATVFDANEVDITDELNAVTGLSATEVGFLDGATAGTPTNSKCVVLGSAGQLGTVVSGTFSTSMTVTNTFTATNNTAGFFGVNVAAQQSTIANATNDADNLMAQVNSVIAVLKTFGLIASA
jgi:hypothetical protein